MRRIIIYPLITLIFLTAALTCMAQEGNWLHGNWQGKAYLPGNDPQQNYDLILTITSIKGKKFDGILKAAKSADTTIKFDSKVTGIINDLYLVINIATWKVNCANCKPQNLAFSIESGKFVFKGEARGCSIECTWITEFSKNMAEFDEGEQQSLHSLAKEEIAPEPEPPVVEKKPEPEVIVPPPVVITPPPAVRIVILPAGAVVLQPHNAALLQPKKPGAPLNKKTSLKIKENIPPPPPERIPVLAAVPVVLKERKNALVPAQKLPSSLTSRPSMAIKQNNPPPPERIPVLAAGPVVLKERKNALVPAQKLPSSLTSRPSMAIKQNNPP
ncbi:MAG TPA: hypothetical protein PLA68_00685, partial [Panacibacter sp.]|nr:hypothetical protein [Panacibacter sp.]